DRAVYASIPYVDRERELVFYTLAVARSVGWIWDIPLHHRVGAGYVYSSRFLSDDAAVDELARFYGPRVKDIQPGYIKFPTGRLRNMWEKNCVAIGLAGGFVELLESSGLMFIQLAINECIWLLVL